MGKGEIDGIVLNTAGVALTGRVVRDRGAAEGDASSSPARSAITAWR